MSNQLASVKPTSLKYFYLFAFAWTWLCWIAAFVILRQNDYPLYSQDSVFLVFTEGIQTPLHSVALLLFGLAVYGPMISGLVLGRPSAAVLWKWRVATWLLLFVAGFSILISLVPGLTDAIISSQAYILSLPFMLIIPYMIYQLVTSSTEEIGWRGVALPQLLLSNTAVDAGWKLGWVWAIWHMPLVIYLYSSLPLAVIVPTLVGFSFSIVGMSIIYTFCFVNSRSLPLMMLLHALTNTFSIALLGVTSNPLVGILPAALVWFTVFVLEKKYGPTLMYTKNTKQVQHD